MKQIRDDYTFDASARTIVFGSTITIEQIGTIVNLTDGIIIYNPADPSKGGTLSTLTLTLDYDTTLMSDTDDLQIMSMDNNAIQQVAGTVTSSVVFPANQTVTGIFNAGTQTVTGVIGGSVTVTNFPNFPTTQTVTGSFNQGTYTITGSLNAGVQYVEGVTVPAPTGTVLMWKDDGAGDVATSVSLAKPLPISSPTLALEAGGMLEAIATYSDLETTTIYADDVVEAAPLGRVVFWQDNADSSKLKAISNDSPLPVTADVTFPTTQTVTGNFNATIGEVTISNFPSTQTVTGNLSVSVGIVTVSAFPVTQTVTGTFWQATQPISGNVGGAVTVTNFPSGIVTVSNFPASQAIGGQVTVTNFPAFPSTQTVTGIFYQATQPISGNIGGAVTVTNFPATQPVSATDLDIRNLANTDVVTAELSAVDNAVLDSIVTNTNFGAVVGGGTEATAVRVTIANNSTGVLSVDDNGGVLTVDGTVSASVVFPVTQTVTANFGQEYTEGDVDSTLTGRVILFEGLGNTVTSVNSSTPLPVTTTFPATQTVTGSFNVGTQTVTGTVGINNYPTTQTVTGNFRVGTQTVTGTFFPTTQTVTGTFWQATQPVSGTVTSIAEPALSSSMVRGNAAVTVTVSTSLIAASGSASLKTYIKSIQVTNMGTVSGSLITLQSNSVTLGYLPAPAAGGSVVSYEIPLVTPTNTSFNFINSTPNSIYISAQGYTAA